MNLLSAENITKTHGDKILFDGITFGIEYDDKIGLLGINGTGKSTLLKILAGIDAPDKGNINKKADLKIQYLPQIPKLDEESTVIKEVFNSNSESIKLIKDYHYISKKISENLEDEKAHYIFNSICEKIDAIDGWELEKDAKTILTKLGLKEFDHKIKYLSGGEKKRVALAKALITPGDLLILDEPTNHIDSNMIDWLEKYLINRKGGLIMVTHDRYFLDRIANKIMEIDKGYLHKHGGNYSSYIEAKLKREEELISKEEKRKNLLKKELAWIRKGVRARGTKQKARLDRYDKLKNESINIADEKINISFSGQRLGKKTIELKNLSKSYEKQKVIDDFSYRFLKGDRVGIIGDNGKGKTTLLNIITGNLSSDRGEVEIGETVSIGYYKQESEMLNTDLRVIDYIEEKGQYVSLMLERFMFPSKDQWKPLSKLSGGEKKRLYLLKVLLKNPNVLIFDEPTNDLDIQTLTILEDFLEDFKGVVIIVSHDRYFLDKTVDKIFSLENDGKISKYTGNYSDYKKTVDVQKNNFNNINCKNSKSNIERHKNEKDNNKKIKLSYKEKKEYETIENYIFETEENLAKINEEINKCGSDYVRLQELTDEKKRLEVELEKLIDRWAFLNEKKEKYERENSI